MTIKSGIGTGPQPILATDTDFFDVPLDRIEVTAFNISNPTGADVVVTLFISPNTTSGAGLEIGHLNIPPRRSLDANKIIGQGYLTGNHIILIADALGTNASMTYTLFTDGD